MRARTPHKLIAPALALLLAGCSSSGGFLSRRTTVGTLKTNVATLEQERDEYRRRVAELEQENRRASDALAQEREANGELTARLDDARALLADQGVTTTARTGLSADPARDPGDDDIPPPSEPARPRRKAPFAQIGGIRAVPYPDEEMAVDEPEPAANDEDLPPPARPASREASGSAPLRWLPVTE